MTNLDIKDEFLKDFPPSSLEEVLAFREERAMRGKDLVARYGFPLLSLGLNMPGEYKRFPLAERSFREETEAVRKSLEAEEITILREKAFQGPGGYGAFFIAAAAADTLKDLARRIEDNHPLGRLFDIDVLKTDGGKISRRDSGLGPRPCLICGGDAFACGRSRAHGAGELRGAAIRLMLAFQEEKLSALVGASVLKALMREVAVTPKPGLVDRANNGSHRDMNFFSFIDSTAALLPYFRDCALRGFRAAGEGGMEPAALFDSLRGRGKIAELEMLAATGGVNTHRGIIFSMGLLSAAFGYFFRREEKVSPGEILDFAAAMTVRIGEDFGRVSGGASHGEALHKASGIWGIRGEARGGFPQVREHSLPVLRNMLASGFSVNDAGITALLHLLAHTEDTNIVHRAGEAALERVRKEASAFLEKRPAMEAMRIYAREKDGEFISENISPGGSADLLALTFFLDQITAK